MTSLINMRPEDLLAPRLLAEGPRLSPERADDQLPKDTNRDKSRRPINNMRPEGFEPPTS